MLDRGDGAFLARPLVMDDVTAAFLLESGPVRGARAADPRPLVATVPLADLRWPVGLLMRLATLVRAHFGGQLPPERRLVCHFHGPDGTGRRTLAAALCDAAGVPLLAVDARELGSGGQSVEPQLRDAFRHAILQGAALLLEHADALCADDEKSDRNLRACVRAIDDLGWL
ncbi:MAG: hypothetical protein DMF86_22005, partial [Acidobacteria bacterium]